ncbi:MAG: tripartite tricarboxylate transporter substrate-binding protein [Alcaligenes sp.]
MKKSKISLGAAIIASFLSVGWLGTAQADSAQTARILVGFPAGGNVDLVARLIAPDLSKALGRPVIVDNRPGASGRLALNLATTSAADGSTFILTPGVALSLYPHTFTELRYEPFKDLAPISNAVNWNLGLAVPSSSGIKSFADYVQSIKTDPNQTFFASSSTGSGQHLAGLYLGQTLGVPLEHVGYKGASEAIVALVGAQVPAAVLNIGELIQQSEAGKVNVLALFDSQRDPLLPNTPSIAELGYPQLKVNGWLAFYAPAGTKPELIQAAQASIATTLNNEAVKEKLRLAGMQSASSTPEELDAKGKKEFEHWQTVTSSLPNFSKF